MFSKKSPKKHPIQSLLDRRCTINGDVSFSDGMKIDGRVFGNVTGVGSPSTLDIGKDAVIEGTVEADYIFIDGTVVGAVKGSTMVVVHGNGNIIGDVQYGRIQMEEGSQIKGQLLPIPAMQAAPALAQEKAIEALSSLGQPQPA